MFEPDVPPRMPARQRATLAALSVPVVAVIVATLLAVGAVAWLLGSLFPPAPIIVAAATSPGGSLEVVAREYDYGATGGEVIVTVRPAGDPDVAGQRVGRFDWGHRPQLSWIDEDTVMVDGSRHEVIPPAP